MQFERRLSILRVSSDATYYFLAPPNNEEELSVTVERESEPVDGISCKHNTIVSD